MHCIYTAINFTIYMFGYLTNQTFTRIPPSPLVLYKTSGKPCMMFYNLKTTGTYTGIGYIMCLKYLLDRKLP